MKIIKLILLCFLISCNKENKNIFGPNTNYIVEKRLEKAYYNSLITMYSLCLDDCDNKFIFENKAMSRDTVEVVSIDLEVDSIKQINDSIFVFSIKVDNSFVPNDYHVIASYPYKSLFSYLYMNIYMNRYTNKVTRISSNILLEISDNIEPLVSNLKKCIKGKEKVSKKLMEILTYSE